MVIIYRRSKVLVLGNLNDPDWRLIIVPAKEKGGEDERFVQLLSKCRCKKHCAVFRIKIVHVVVSDRIPRCYFVAQNSIILNSIQSM